MAKHIETRKVNKLTSITAWHDLARNRFGFLLIAGFFAFGIIAYFGSGPGGGMGDTGRRRDQGRNDAVALVNGESITRGEADSAFQRVKQFSRGNDANAVQFEGMILNQLVDQAILRGEAKKQGLTVSDAEIDKSIAEMKKGPDGKPISDSQFTAMLAEQGISEDTVRDQVRRGLSGKVVMDKLAAGQKVTEEDLRKSYDEVKVRHILVSNSKLPDEQARRKAEKILEEVKAGKDFAALANKYSDDPGNDAAKPDPKTKRPAPTGEKKGGLMDFAPASNYVPEFAAAALALKPGETSGVVKTQFGYHIIKLEDKRSNLPKDFDKDKAKLLTDLKEKRAQKPQSDFIDQARKTAKIEWKDPALKWKYDYNKLSGGMMGMMPPPGGDHAKDEKAFLDELRAYVIKNPDDTQAQAILGKTLDTQLMMAGLPAIQGHPAPISNPADRDKLRAEVISAYEAALKRSEDQATRFRLATLYKEAKQNDKALDQYQKVKKFSAWDDSGAGTKFTHMQLQQGFKDLGRADLASEEAAKIAELSAAEEKKKKEDAVAAAAAKAQEKSAPSTGSINLSPGKGVSVTPPAPASSGDNSKESAPTGGKPGSGQ